MRTYFITFIRQIQLLNNFLILLAQKTQQLYKIQKNRRSPIILQISYKQISMHIHEQNISLPSDFYTALLASEEQYHKNRDKATMGILLTKYTDCIAYFQSKQDPVTQYFQAKMKQLLKNVKYFTNSRSDLQANRVKMAKDMYQVLESELSKAHQNMSEEFDKQKKMNFRVNKILTEQEISLEQRIKSSKRFSCYKSNSRKNTLSFATLSSNHGEFGQFSKTSPPKHKTNYKVSSSFANPKITNQEDDQDIKQYFAEGAIITTQFQEHTDDDYGSRIMRRNNSKREKKRKSP